MGCKSRKERWTSSDAVPKFVELPSIVRYLADLFALAVGVFVCVTLVWFGARVTWAKYLTNEYDYFKLDDVPIYIIYVIIPIGGLMLLLQLVRDVRRRIRSLSDPDAVQIEERVDL